MKNKWLLITALITSTLSLNSCSLIDNLLSILNIDDGITYTLSEDNSYYAVTGCKSTIKKPKIKSSIDDIPVLEIKDNAFAYCEDLESITIPSSILSIGDRAFNYCFNLENIVFSNGLISIGDYAFSRCSKLTRLDIPSTVTSIGICIIDICSNIESLTVDKDNHTFDSRNDCNAIINTSTNTLITGCKNTIIPNDVTAIGAYAFATCEHLIYIEIPSSVNFIGDYAFMRCVSLKSLIIPSSVTTMGKNVITYWNQLTVYCEASSKPEGWDDDWFEESSLVVWNYKK